MRRLSLSVAVLVLSLAGIGIGSQQSAAAPLPANYTATAGGDLVAIELNRAVGSDLTGVRVAVSRATMDGGATPSSDATASNLEATVAGLSIAVNSDTQTAPPDHPLASSDTIAASTDPGLFSIEALTTTVQARTQAAVACTPSGGTIARSEVKANGATLDPAPLGTIVDTGLAVTSGTVAIFPQPPGNLLDRAVLATALGTINANSFLNGSVQIAIAGQSVLQARATGEPGGAEVLYTPGSVAVTAGGTTTPMAPGSSAVFAGINGQVEVTVNQPSIAESPNGQVATGTVSVVTAEVTVGSVVSPLAEARVDLLPLRASAVAPPGGIDCPPNPPVLNTPTHGSTTADTTPTFTGTATPDAEVEIIVNGSSLGTTTANNAGNFSFTPTTALPTGLTAAAARQTTEGGTSAGSNVNEFTILGPPVLADPADGTVTNDTTPTFTGTALPGALVDLLVDGNPIGTTTANGSGNFSFTPGTALAPGDYEASARARANGVTSGSSNVNDFTIDTNPPAAPTLNRPADGEVTRDRTPRFTGTAEPGAEVEIFVDGASIGTTTANGNGAFSFTPTAALAAGPHEAFVGATDAAGNDSPASNTNDFRIDTDAPAAPVIVSPDDGDTTTDPTPTIRGTAEPGSQVIIFVDGERIGSTVADEDGEFSFTVPEGLSLGTHEVAAIAVDEAGNRSNRSIPVGFAVLAARADAGPSLADAGGPQAWLPPVAGLGVLVGTCILAVARRRRQDSQA